MILSSYEKKIVFVVEAVALVALLFGKYAVLPLIGEMPPVAAHLFCGLSALALLWCLVTLWSGIAVNLQLRSQMRSEFPKDAEEFRRIGVEKPLDFAYAVSYMLIYVPVPLMGSIMTSPRMRCDRKLFKESVRIFEEMYGRKPFGVKTKDWDEISQFEAADYFRAECGEVDFEDFEAAVSPELRRYVKKFVLKNVEAMKSQTLKHPKD